MLSNWCSEFGIRTQLLIRRSCSDIWLFRILSGTLCFIVCMYVSFCLTSGAVNLKVLRLDLKDLSQINWLYARTSLVYKALCRNLKTPHSGIITSKYEAGIVSESNSLSFKFYLMLQHLKLKQMCFS